MKYLIYFGFILFTLSMMSCDGRYRAQKSQQQVWIDNKLPNPLMVKTQFIPEGYTEIFTDTILKNGYHIKVNYHSIESTSLVKGNQSLHQNHPTQHYKNFEAHLLVLKNNEEIVNTLLDKSDFETFENSSFWKKAIMQFLWIDYARSHLKTLYLNTSFCTPDNELCKDFVIKINAKGDLQIAPINLDEYTF